MMTHTELTFKTGTYPLNHEPNFNFQLNRTHLWSSGNLDELRRVGPTIKSTSDWVRELTGLAEKALAERRSENAIGYFRMAEFFMFDGNPKKLEVYRKARDLFYEYHANLFESGTIKRTYVPYKNVQLPLWIAIPEKQPAREALLLHGGNDSYIEEFLPMVLYLRQMGFAVYLFEGPGQGEVLREQGMPLTHEWEKPVKTILDALGLKEVTLIGGSLGGVLAPRAAAYEKRIKRLVAWSIFPDFLDIVIATRKKNLRPLIRILLKLRAKPLINAIFRRQMDRDPLTQWGLEHGMHNMGVRSPYDYVMKTARFQMTDIAHLIEQDFLLLGASNDHFIPVEFYKTEIDHLANVRSLTYRLFTAKESAESHCNIGNTKLVLDTIIAWVDSIKNNHLA